jgi:hypothetical protein
MHNVCMQNMTPQQHADLLVRDAGTLGVAQIECQLMIRRAARKRQMEKLRHLQAVRTVLSRMEATAS